MVNCPPALHSQLSGCILYPYIYTAALLCRRRRRHPSLCSYVRTAACCSPRREIHYHDNGVHTVNVRRESYIADCYVTAAAAAGWIAHCGGGNQFRIKSVLSTPLSLRNSYWSSSECKEFKNGMTIFGSKPIFGYTSWHLITHATKAHTT